MVKEVDAVTKLYDYLLWVIPKLGKFPRNQKFLIADRIENSLLDTLELLIEAAYSREKLPFLHKANLNLEKIRYLIRLSKDLELMSLKSYEYSARSINDVGISIGGWIKFMKKR